LSISQNFKLIDVNDKTFFFKEIRVLSSKQDGYTRTGKVLRGLSD